jgi:hypothetical protein
MRTLPNLNQILIITSIVIHDRVASINCCPHELAELVAQQSSVGSYCTDEGHPTRIGLQLFKHGRYYGTNWDWPGAIRKKDGDSLFVAGQVP